MPFLQDLRYGIRTLTRTPGFTLMAVAVLALGIGVNATVFSLANAFFLRPLPVSDPGSIVRVYANRFSNVRYRTYRELRDRNYHALRSHGVPAPIVRSPDRRRRRARVRRDRQW